MESLILEIKTRGLHRYHRLDKSELSIGRALDNDIILSDPTVEPYHLKILCDDEGNIELQNLASVNPVKIINRRGNKFDSAALPIEFSLGRISAQVLSPDHRVAETKSLTNYGFLEHLFSRWEWAVLLLSLCFVVAGLEYYFTSYHALQWDDLIKYVLRESVLSLAALIFTLSVLEHLLVNRWEIKPVTISVTLVYLIFQLFSLIAAELTYLFSSDLPISIFSLGWFLLFIPVVICFYLIRVTHLGQGKAILLAALISGPFAILAIMQNPAINLLLDDFSPTANYQNSLSPLNWHLLPTVSTDSFISEAAELEPGEFSH
jgi:hypothetical protein